MARNRPAAAADGFAAAEPEPEAGLFSRQSGIAMVAVVVLGAIGLGGSVAYRAQAMRAYEARCARLTAAAVDERGVEIMGRFFRVATALLKAPPGFVPAPECVEQFRKIPDLLNVRILVKVSGGKKTVFSLERADAWGFEVRGQPRQLDDETTAHSVSVDIGRQIMAAVRFRKDIRVESETATRTARLEVLLKASGTAE